MKKILALISLLSCSSLLWAQDFERYKKLKDTILESSYLGYEKSIRITVPIEWQHNIDNDFPLIILFDSQNHRSHNYILNTIDYLTSNEQMPSCVILSIESDQQHRYVETLHKASSSKGRAGENEDFIFNELIPMAEKEFMAGGFYLFIGHSRYGYFTTSLLKSRTADVNAVISLSPFFEQENVDLVDSVSTLLDSDFLFTKYYRYSIGSDYPDDFKKMDTLLKENLNSKFSTSGILFKEADHNATPGLTIATALYDIFEFWSAKQNSYFEEKGLESITNIQSDIFDHYGDSLRLSLGTLNGKGWSFFNENKYEEAITAWEILAKNYPNFSSVYLFIAEAQKALQKDTSESMKAFEMSLEKTTLYSEAEKEELLLEIGK